MEKYRKEFFAQKLDGKSYLDFMRIENGEGNTCWMHRQIMQLLSSKMVSCKNLSSIMNSWFIKSKFSGFINKYENKMQKLV